MKVKSQKLIIYTISSIYGIGVWQGLYGYGHDYYAAYSRSNISWGDALDRLGYILSTLTIGNTHFGVLIVTCLISLSLGKSLNEYFTANDFTKNSQLLNFTLIYILFLHSWPIIMSNSNAMRQGLMMSFLYLSLLSFDKHKKKAGCSQMIAMLFMHKSGLIFAFYIVSSILFNTLTIKLKYSEKLKNSLLVALTSLLLSTLFFAIPLFFGKIEASRVISMDTRPIFLFINIMYVLFFFLFLKKAQRNTITSQVLLASSVASPMFLLYGFNWQYERLNMIVLILYIIDFSYFFKPYSRLIYLFSSSFLLMLATIMAGMFAALH